MKLILAPIVKNRVRRGAGEGKSSSKSSKHFQNLNEADRQESLQIQTYLLHQIYLELQRQQYRNEMLTLATKSGVAFLILRPFITRAMSDKASSILLVPIGITFLFISQALSKNTYCDHFLMPRPYNLYLSKMQLGPSFLIHDEIVDFIKLVHASRN